jgi:hypothetical protein
MLVIAVVGYAKSESMKEQTDVMDALNLGVLTIIIVAAAGATVFTSFLGFMGAYFRSMLTLKLVRNTRMNETRHVQGPTALVCSGLIVFEILSSVPSFVCFVSTSCWC